MWKAKSCDHGNMEQQRHYWSDPYHGLSDTLPNQAFWSPTTTTRKAFQILLISCVACAEQWSLPLYNSKHWMHWVEVVLFFCRLKLNRKPRNCCIFPNQQVDIRSSFCFAHLQTAVCWFLTPKIAEPFDMYLLYMLLSPASNWFDWCTGPLFPWVIALYYPDKGTSI